MQIQFCTLMSARDADSRRHHPSSPATLQAGLPYFRRMPPVALLRKSVRAKDGPLDFSDLR